jgi:matrixin
MRKSARSLPLLLALIAGCQGGDSLSPTGVARADRAVDPDRLAQETFVDYAKPPNTGGGLTVTTESGDFKLFYGGARWFSGGQVDYTIEGSQPISQANSAVAAGVATIDGFVTARSFALKNTTTQTNPCTGLPNTIEWVSIDGPGNILGSTSFCYYLGTKEIIGFTVKLDKDEPWAIGSVQGTFDVQNIATHEFGHVAGLAHVSAPKDVCLTMYPYADYGETQKRTLGLGDKLGMQKLYSSTDVSAGACGS